MGSHTCTSGRSWAHSPLREHLARWPALRRVSRVGRAGRPSGRRACPRESGRCQDSVAGARLLLLAVAPAAGSGWLLPLLAGGGRVNDSAGSGFRPSRCPPCWARGTSGGGEWEWAPATCLRCQNRGPYLGGERCQRRGSTVEHGDAAREQRCGSEVPTMAVGPLFDKENAAAGVPGGGGISQAAKASRAQARRREWRAT
jgi:hypothetical protein